MRAQTFEQIKKYNPYHGKDGKFTSGGSAAKTVRSRKSQVAGCKTAKQLANTVDKKYGIRMVGDIESLDFDSVKGTADGVAAAIDKFPELTGKINLKPMLWECNNSLIFRPSPSPRLHHRLTKNRLLNYEILQNLP